MNAPTTLQSRVADYLAERRRLGFELEDQGRTLMSFARYVDHLGSPGPLTVEIMAEWARRDRQHRDTPETWARRLMRLRPFTRYLRQFDPGTEIPDESIFGPVPRRRTPHIFEDQEIADLLAAARGLGPHGDLRAATYETLFGLIAAAGLRVSEAAHLLDTDIDLTQGLLTIRQTKFHKSRQLPLHPTTTEALQRYRQLRRQYLSDTPGAPFLVATRGQRRGQPLGLRHIARVFEQLRDQLQWSNRGDHAAPRIHDLRHTFAVRRVLLWHERGIDIDQAMLALSTYLGHVKISDTYWYLTGIPDLMAAAARMFEVFAETPGGAS